MLAWAARASDRLLELDDDDERVGRLTAQEDQLTAEVADARRARSAGRAGRRAAGWAALVGDELTHLAMPHAALRSAVQRDDAAASSSSWPTADGASRSVDGRRRGRAAAAPACRRAGPAAGQGASGGELSRVMLALEVVLAGADPVPTFVFDEVDAGVGGRAAVEIGRRLARLARTARCWS